MTISDDLILAKDIIQVFLKGKKILRMYPQNNPIYMKTIEDSFNKFDDFFTYQDTLRYVFRQNEILYDTEQVYENPEKEDNLALFFFKDGLREITFRKGLTANEMEDFLRIISMDFEREVLEDDIVTLFWEKDFENIQYVVDETFLADEEDYESQAMSELEEKHKDPDNLLQAYEDAFKQEDAKEIAVVQIVETELQILFKELEDDAQDKIEKLNNILFEILISVERKNEYADVATSLIASVEYAIGKGNLDAVRKLLVRLKRLTDRQDIDGDLLFQAKRVIYFAGSEKVITALGEMLDSGQEIDEKLFDEYIDHLEKNAILPFIKVLGELKTIHARKIVIDALVTLGPKDILTLTKGLNDPRWYVTRNIIYILRNIGDKRAVDHLLKTVQHTDIRVKKEVIRTLGELGGSNVLVALRNCLDDKEIQVRIAALKAFSNISSDTVKKMLMDRIMKKEFKDKSFEEKKEYFTTLANWKDSEVLEFLVKVMKKRSFFGRSKLFENKAVAAHCLGLIGSKKVLPLLNKHKNSNSKLLREYAYTAIKRIDSAQ
ncbi:MAG: HEAT repeat domain-containing protein [Nitrospiraceae bacterium]|nr:MAG: HEAT repeat domain-containing protein [Nitrospiraceae bacterium]